MPSCYWCTICYRRTCHQIYQPGIWCQLISLIHVWRSSIQPTTKLCSIICWLYFYELSRSSLPFSPHFIRTHPITIPSSGVTSIIQPWSGLDWTWWSREKVTDLLKHQILYGSALVWKSDTTSTLSKPGRQVKLYTRWSQMGNTSKPHLAELDGRCWWVPWLLCKITVTKKGSTFPRR